MNDTKIHNVLVSQYKASLRMLGAALKAVPPHLWDSDDYPNKTWRLLYHTLWGTRFYLGASPQVLVPWEKAIEGAESLGGWWEDPAEEITVTGQNSPEELQEFLDSAIASLPAAIASLPLDGDSGFEWYPFSRLELHLMNIRHIQHHTAQVIERLRWHGITGTDWVYMGEQGTQPQQQ